MSAKYLTTFAIILFNLQYSPSYADDCSARVSLLDEKLNRVLYILESTFKVPATSVNGKSSDYYGVPMTNSGKSNIYTPKKGSLNNDYAGVGSSLGALNKLKTDYKPKKSKDDDDKLGSNKMAAAIERGGYRNKALKDDVMYETDKEKKIKGYSDQDAFIGVLYLLLCYTVTLLKKI